MRKKSVKLNITVTPEQRTFLDNLCNQVKTNDGFRMSNAGIIRGAVRLLNELDLDLKDVGNEDELLERLRTAVTQFNNKKEEVYD